MCHEKMIVNYRRTTVKQVITMQYEFASKGRYIVIENGKNKRSRRTRAFLYNIKIISLRTVGTLRKQSGGLFLVPPQ